MLLAELADLMGPEDGKGQRDNMMQMNQQKLIKCFYAASHTLRIWKSTGAKWPEKHGMQSKNNSTTSKFGSHPQVQLLAAVSSACGVCEVAEHISNQTWKYT
jgi:hypothetical protein